MFEITGTIRVGWIQPELCFTLNRTSIYFRGKLKMDFTLPVGYRAPFILPVGGFDAQGNPTQLKSPPTCRVSDTQLLQVVQPNPNTPDIAHSGVLRGIGGVGKAQFVVEDVDEGPSPLTILVNVNIIPGDTVTLGGVEFGELEPDV